MWSETLFRLALCMLRVARLYGTGHRSRRSLRAMSSSTVGGQTGQPGSGSGSGSKAPTPTLVMQIIVRRDLQTVRLHCPSRDRTSDWQEHGWPIGPLMAQSAHAATAVLEAHKDTSAVQAYLSDLKNMRKVVMEVCPLAHASIVSNHSLRLIYTGADGQSFIGLGGKTGHAGTPYTILSLGGAAVSQDASTWSFCTSPAIGSPVLKPDGQRGRPHGHGAGPEPPAESPEEGVCRARYRVVEVAPLSPRLLA